MALRTHTAKNLVWIPVVGRALISLYITLYLSPNSRSIKVKSHQIKLVKLKLETEVSIQYISHCTHDSNGCDLLTVCQCYIRFIRIFSLV